MQQPEHPRVPAVWTACIKEISMFRTLLPVLMLLLAGQPLPPLPETPRKAITDIHHGVAVTDEYRWLEKTDDPAVRTWIEAQNRHARSALDKLPALKPVRERLAQLDSDPAPSYFVLQPRAGRLFALKRESGKEQPFLVVLESADRPDSARVLLDPNVVDPRGKT